MPWFGAAGLLIGFFCSLAGLLAAVFLRGLSGPGIPSIFISLLCGLMWLAAEIWLSRCLHWDGLADVGDALGSGAKDEKFWQILKDSRLGTFGAMAIFVVFIAQWLAASSHFQSAMPSGKNFFCPQDWNLGHMLALVFACAWGRLAPLWLARAGMHHEGSWLGSAVCRQAGMKTRLCAWLCALAMATVLCYCGLPLFHAVLLFAAQIALNLYMYKTAIGHGGLSGDFFGAGMELSQTLFLFSTLF